MLKRFLAGLFTFAIAFDHIHFCSMTENGFVLRASRDVLAFFVAITFARTVISGPGSM